jgi:hypothetical protein
MPRVVTIGATDLTKHVKDVQIRQITEAHTQYHEANIVLDVAGLSEYYYVNLRDRVIIEIEHKREFAGVVIESYPIEPKIHVLNCRSAAQYLQELVITKAAFENFTPQEIVYYLVKQQSDIDASERSIHGLVLNKNLRDFFVAVPIHSLAIKKPASISNVRFFRLEPTSHDTKVMAEKGKWAEGTAIASLIVKAPGFIEAWANGRDTISRLVDSLSYSATLSTLGHPTQSGNYESYDWLRDNTFSKLSLGSETFLRDMSTDPPKTWLRGEPTTESELDLGKAEQSSLIQVSDATLRASDSMKSLAAAVRWLRLGTQENDPTDRLLDYWISLEFLVSHEKVSTFLSTDGLKDLESALLSASVKKPDGSLMTPAELNELSLRSASRINNVDLRERFDAFVRTKTQTVTITTPEYDCIWGNGGLREQRNGLEHGRSAHVDEDALKIMKHVLDKMILALII